MAIHRPGDDLPTERTVFGTREEALATARSMINALLKKSTRLKTPAAPEPMAFSPATAAECRVKADECERKPKKQRMLKPSGY